MTALFEVNATSLASKTVACLSSQGRPLIEALSALAYSQRNFSCCYLDLIPVNVVDIGCGVYIF